MKSRNKYFLIGPMGAGKTSVGRALARTLNFTFYDTDNVIEEQSGVTIPWIFDIEGEQGFRKREREIINQLTQKEKIVLATGGGSILSSEVRSYLQERGIVVYLKTSIEDQITRTKKSKNRPLLINKNPKEVFEKLKDEREIIYHKMADLTVETQTGSIPYIVNLILSAVEKMEN